MEGLVNLRGKLNGKTYRYCPIKQVQEKVGVPTTSCTYHATSRMKWKSCWISFDSEVLPLLSPTFAMILVTKYLRIVVFHGFSMDFRIYFYHLPALTQSRRHADSAQVKILPKGFMRTSPLKARGTGDICFCFSLKNDSLGEKKHRHPWI